ncbi:cell adhesion molecule CEACAM1 isoform X3 [Callospermophilus lateralis]|uniref:cell adhesion molecule CEACAM1 isoform X3 n=1 Tax=Callospermophilus lateralis TaxID=76772 RepID=UPI004053CCEC
MQPPLACPCRGCIPWQGILLAVSLLTFWNPHPTAQLTIEPVPSDAAEGTDVLLLVHNASQNIIGYNWFKGETADSRHEIISYVVPTQMTTPGPAFSGREKIYSNGSLLIQNVTQNDTGFYTLQTVTANARVELATGEFHVHEPVTPPHLTASNTTVAEGESVQLTCVPNDTEISIQWLFNNNTLQLTDRMQLSLNNSILTINSVKKTDEGEYHCQVSNQVFSEKSNPITLTVIAVPDGDGGHPPDGLSPGAIAGIVIGVLAGVGLIAGLGYFLFFRKTGGASDQHDLTEHIPSASNHSPGPSDHSPDKGDEVAYSSLNFNIEQPTQPTSATSPSPTATDTVYSELKKK